MGNIIYHYCNVEAFKAIIQNKILWLSSVYNLNDYKEIHWIKDKVKKRLDELKTKETFPKYKAFEKIYNEELPRVYIASFSQGADLLSQWRAYANDGFGVAIGFNTDYLKNNPLVFTSKVLYDEKKQEEKIEKILEPLSELSNTMAFDSEEFIYFSKELISKINNLSAKSKNQLFQEEQEVRLIHNPIIFEDKENKEFVFKNNLSEMKFRAVCGNLIPYFELDFSEDKKEQTAILEIIKGPKNKFIDEEIRIFLSANGFYNVEIKSSKSSYR